MKIRKMCSKCGYHQDKCRCGSIRTISAKRKVPEYAKVLNTARWKKKRKFIKERDGHFCQRCWALYGIVNDKNLEVHHIKNRRDFPELTFEDSNLITVCKTCNLQLGVATELDFNWEPLKNKIDNSDISL